MPSPTDQLELVGLMAAHESAIAELYRKYAARFPEQRELFEHLASEEVGHARLIAGFADQVRAGAVQIAPGRFTSREVLASLDHVQDETGRTPDVPLLHALSVSVSLEEMLLEKRFLEVVEGDGEELRQLLERLAADTAAHRERVREAWEGERLRAGEAE